MNDIIDNPYGWEGEYIQAAIDASKREQELLSKGALETSGGIYKLIEAALEIERSNSLRKHAYSLDTHLDNLNPRTVDTLKEYPDADSAKAYAEQRIKTYTEVWNNLPLKQKLIF